MMRVLIVGCGYVGGRLAVHLARGGHEVWGITRSPGPKLPGVRPMVADVADFGTLPVLPGNLDGVVYCVAPASSRPAAYRAVYVEGLRNVLTALDCSGSPRVVLTSSTAVYGQDGGERVDERSVAAPSSPTGRLVLEGEGVLMSGVSNAIAVRFGGIYGPGRTRLLDRVRSQQARRAASTGLAKWTNRIHVTDCVGSLAHLLTIAQPAAIYNGVDSEPSDLDTVLQWIGAELGMAVPRSAAGEGEGTGAPRLGKRCANDRLLQAGYTMRFPSFREGYRDLIHAREETS